VLSKAFKGLKIAEALTEERKFEESWFMMFFSLGGKWRSFVIKGSSTVI